MKKVILADDHPISRAGLRQILEEEGGYDIVAETGNGKSCISIIEMLMPDIVILDLAMPGMDGYEVLTWMKTNASAAIGIILSMHSSRSYATKAKDLGARAFIAKEDAGQELHNALLTPNGVFYLSASVGNGGRIAGLPGVMADERGRLDTLTPTEKRVFDLVGQSFTSRQIGEALGISHRTVQTHRQRMVQKLGLQGPNSLLEFAIRLRNSLAAGS